MVILKFVTDEAVEVSFPLRTFIVYRPGSRLGRKMRV